MCVYTTCGEGIVKALIAGHDSAYETAHRANGKAVMSGVNHPDVAPRLKYFSELCSPLEGNLLDGGDVKM